MNKLIVIPILALILIVIDLYAYGAFKSFFKETGSRRLRYFSWGYMALTFFSLAFLCWYHFGNREWISEYARVTLLSLLNINYFSKLFIVLFLVIGDLINGLSWVLRSKQKSSVQEQPSSAKGNNKISRGEFIKRASVITAAVPFTTMTFGIVNGVHNYRVFRRTLKLPHLPGSFHGMTIAQISDIHSGSFFDKKSVVGGIEMLLKEKPDMVFFTGDLVNNETKEVDEYIDVFKKVKAPHGVYSVLGNHDYGNYRAWSSAHAKAQNLKDMHHAHDLLGWQLLNNHHKILNAGRDQLAIVGVENWGTGRFPKYGNMTEALKGTDEAAVKLLLSHDPSHWDAEIRPHYPDIDATFAGHTHGFQVGIETRNFRWSPSQYLYKQWADLYQEEGQYLYVNRGFGFLGFPGRIGIDPEITLITLEKGHPDPVA